jgi:hypothetical protein
MEPLSLLSHSALTSELRQVWRGEYRVIRTARKARDSHAPVVHTDARGLAAQRAPS